MRGPLAALIVAMAAASAPATASAADWSRPEPLPADAKASALDLDVNATGDGVAVYQVGSSDALKLRIVGAYRRAGRQWTAHTLGEIPSGGGGDIATAAIDGRGRAAIAWADLNGLVRLDTFDPATGAWRPVGSYGTPPGLGHPRLASAPGGRTLLVFGTGQAIKGQVASSPIALSPSAPT